MEKPVVPENRKVVFDVGNVLLRWDPFHLYRNLIPDDAKRDWFLRNVCTSAWNLEQDRGRPWAEVNYAKARRAQRLFDSQFAADRWLSSLLERRGYQAFAWD